MKYLIFVVMLLPKLCLAQAFAPNTKIHSTEAVDHVSDAPPANAIIPLQIGDAVPDVVLSNMLNYNTTSARLNNFNGRLIVLDFWATWCGPCIKELPVLDSVQKQFAQNVQVLVIAYEPKQIVQAFIKSNKVAASVSLPFATGDSVLSKLFPHNTIPHQVWIYDGYVIAITGAGYTTAKNIQASFSGTLNLPVKKDFIGFNKKAPLLQNGNGGNEQDVISRSLFTKHLSGVKEGYGSDVSNGHKRIYAINLPVLALYNIAIGKRINNRVVLEVSDSSRFINNNHDGEWNRSNTFSYELTVPQSLAKEKVNNIILQDINRYLNLHGRMEKRLVKCMAISILDSAKFKTNGGTPRLQLATREQPYAIFTNKPLTSLVEALNHYVPGYPLKPAIIDETNYTGNVDLHLESTLDDLEALKQQLNLYGFKLTWVYRQLEVLVITDAFYKAANPGTYKLQPTSSGHHPQPDSQFAFTPFTNFLKNIPH